ncbi:hypothetical protein QQS21_003527 [Conoideocrella luteorostrata]|uniref:PLAT domain-containing protein n=1 Tax=Conoideocrella luteorostrata TaxID=1105319 RepID=A0AAJ0CVV1_9HYPO|nr:hypothetical protein QQS21_003527 [Conoideocrella luteorostrata]
MRKLFAYVALAGLGSVLPGVYAAARDDELNLISKRRIADMAQFPDATWFTQIPTWLKSQKYDGTWADVNYLSGCSARHWNRLITFAAAWSGANPAVAQNWTRSDELLKAISKGLDYWFNNDYEPADLPADALVEHPACGIPYASPAMQCEIELCASTCMLLKNANLTTSQKAGCERIPRRAYDLRDGVYGTGGRMTGANAVLVMQNSASLALYTNNAAMLQDVFTRAMSVITFADKPMEDGIHRDGTFLQHAGILYNGNYGKDLFNAFIQLESEAIGTSFAAGNSTRGAVAAQVRGNEWMIFVDENTKQQYWDFNAIGRFVAFPTRDLQANADINFNVTKLAAAVADFAGPSNVNDTIRRLQSNGTDKLVGNKGFWASDYMVHRTKSFMIGNKLLSSRSRNTEAVNSANPYGYHLGQGTLFTYVEGNEYKDIMGAWDWNLIPGTTTLLKRPTLSAKASANIGKKDFVGVVSDGKVGSAVEDYIDPLDGTISYRKAWFYQDDFVLVVTSDIKKNASDTPVITVLENRATHNGNIWVDGRNVQAEEGKSLEGKTLFYGGNGYLSYDQSFDLTLFEGNRSGNWSEISTSTAGISTASLFSAYTTIKDKTFSYAFFPASSRATLAKELDSPTVKPIVKNGISGAIGSDRLSLVFWPGGEESITLKLRDIGWDNSGSVTITSSQPAAYLFAGKCKRAGKGITLVVTLSDPSQKAMSASFSLKFEGAKASLSASGVKDGRSGSEPEVEYSVDLPSGGMAGSSISRKMYLELTG